MNPLAGSAVASDTSASKNLAPEPRISPLQGAEVTEPDVLPPAVAPCEPSAVPAMAGANVSEALQEKEPIGGHQDGVSAGSQERIMAEQNCETQSEHASNERKIDDWGDGESSEEIEEPHETDAVRARELRLQGNDFFKAGKVHDAREAYSEAIHLMPDTEKKEKAVFYGNRAACHQKFERWEDVINDCREAVKLDPEYAKAWHRRSLAYEAQGKFHDANEDLKKAIEFDPQLRSKEYRRQVMLEKRAAEQFEKDKDEMMGKLKDLGNMVLGKFGMSVDNFNMEQDPQTGSYSIKYNN